MGCPGRGWHAFGRLDNRCHRACAARCGRRTPRGYPATRNFFGGGGVVESECEGAANHTEMTADNETGIELSMRSLSIGSADQQQHAAPVGEEAENERHRPEKASGVANISASASSSWSNWGGFYSSEQLDEHEAAQR